MIRWILGAGSLFTLGTLWWSFFEEVRANERPAAQESPEFPLQLRGVLPKESQARDLFECWLGDEIVLARSSRLGHDSLPRFARDPGVPTFRDIELPDGRTARAVAVRYLPPSIDRPDPLRSSLVPDVNAPVAAPGAHPVEVVVAQPNEELDGILTQLRILITASWVVTSLLSAAGLTWVVRRGLAPLEDLGEQIQSKDEAQLGTPFSLPGASVELAPVVDRLNGFRERVGSAIDREHAFAAHAAHELRTPLAGLRSTLEVSLSRERDASEHRESEQTALGITTQLERLVGRLLELARTASPSTVVRLERFALRQLAQESWTPYSDAAAERGVFLEIEMDPSIHLRSDRQLLGRVLQNLLENLGNYADEGSVARLHAAVHQGEVLIHVENQCSGLDDEMVAHVFDAFWRSDEARTAVGRHAGLGLALCRQLVELLSGTINATGENQTFRVTLVLPRDGFTPHSLDGSEAADRAEEKRTTGGGGR